MYVNYFTVVLGVVAFIFALHFLLTSLTVEKPTKEDIDLEKVKMLTANPHSIATIVTDGIIRQATKRVLSAIVEEIQLSIDLDRKMAELKHFDKLVDKEMKKTVKKLSTFHSKGHAYYKEWLENRKNEVDLDVDLTLYGNGTFYMRMIEERRRRLRHKKKSDYFIAGDKYGDDFMKVEYSSNESSDGYEYNKKKVKFTFKETKEGIERIAKIPFAVTARDLMKDTNFQSTVNKEISVISVPFGTENFFRNEGESSQASLATLSDDNSAKTSLFREDDDGNSVDFSLTEMWSHQVLSTPPSYPKPSSSFKSTARKILTQS